MGCDRGYATQDFYTQRGIMRITGFSSSSISCFYLIHTDN